MIDRLGRYIIFFAARSIAPSLSDFFLFNVISFFLCIFGAFITYTLLSKGTIYSRSNLFTILKKTFFTTLMCLLFSNIHIPIKPLFVMCMNTTTVVESSDNNPSVTVTSPNDQPTKDNVQKNVSSSNLNIIDDPVKGNTPRECYDHMVILRNEYIEDFEKFNKVIAENEKKGIDSKRDKFLYEVSINNLANMEKRMCKMEKKHGFEDPYEYE